jgi:hypothetical protein
MVVPVVTGLAVPTDTAETVVIRELQDWALLSDAHRVSCSPQRPPLLGYSLSSSRSRLEHAHTSSVGIESMLAT